jgi:hypothetical protein
MTISRFAIAVLLGASLAFSGVALAQSPSPRMTGTWQFSCTNRRGRTREFSVQVQQDGSTLSGTFSARHGTGKLSGSVNGDQVSLILSGQRGSLSLTGTIADDTVNVHSSRGVTCSATRR